METKEKIKLSEKRVYNKNMEKRESKKKKNVQSTTYKIKRKNYHEKVIKKQLIKKGKKNSYQN